jgi:hypothetical protein
LYKFASDEPGKRHGSVDFVASGSEDCRFVIVTCSALFNYLVILDERARASK